MNYLKSRLHLIINAFGALSGCFALMLSVANGQDYRGKQVEYGEYQKGRSVYSGEIAAQSGNIQGYVLKDMNGKVIFSTSGGWVSDRGPNRPGSSLTPTEIWRIRSEYEARETARKRRVRDGRENVEFGEYVNSRQGTFSGYTGHLAGSPQDQRFISSRYGMIYSSRGGWVRGFGPEAERILQGGTGGGKASASQWGPGVPTTAWVYEINAGQSVRIHSSTQLEENRIYRIVTPDRKTVYSISYREGSRIRVAYVPLPVGRSIQIKGSMVGYKDSTYRDSIGNFTVLADGRYQIK